MCRKGGCGINNSRKAYECIVYTVIEQKRRKR
jgi:hypothetical protein